VCSKIILTWTAHCCQRLPLLNAAVQPFEGDIRGSRSILLDETSVSGQSCLFGYCTNAFFQTRHRQMLIVSTQREKQ